VQASTGAPTPQRREDNKRQRAKTHLGNTDAAAARPVEEDDGEMSQGSYRSNQSGRDGWRSWKDNRGRDAPESRRKPTRRGGGGRFDKSMI
jgi:hypothetical protein